jgi:hypothetical protein
MTTLVLTRKATSRAFQFSYTELDYILTGLRLLQADVEGNMHMTPSYKEASLAEIGELKRRLAIEIDRVYDDPCDPTCTVEPEQV